MKQRSEDAVTHMQQNSTDYSSISFLIGDIELIKTCQTTKVLGSFNRNVINYLDCVSK